MELLRCCTCHEYKEPDQFSKSRNKRGRHYQCRHCNTKLKYRMYQENPEPTKKASIKWSDNNPDKKSESWAKSHEKFIARGRIRRDRVGAPTKEELEETE